MKLKHSESQENHRKLYPVSENILLLENIYTCVVVLLQHPLHSSCSSGLTFQTADGSSFRMYTTVLFLSASQCT